MAGTADGRYGELKGKGIEPGALALMIGGRRVYIAAAQIPDFMNTIAAETPYQALPVGDGKTAEAYLIPVGFTSGAEHEATRLLRTILQPHGPVKDAAIVRWAAKPDAAPGFAIRIPVASNLVPEGATTGEYRAGQVVEPAHIKERGGFLPFAAFAAGILVSSNLGRGLALAESAHEAPERQSSAVFHQAVLAMWGGRYFAIGTSTPSPDMERGIALQERSIKLNTHSNVLGGLAFALTFVSPPVGGGLGLIATGLNVQGVSDDRLARREEFRVGQERLRGMSEGFNAALRLEREAAQKGEPAPQWSPGVSAVLTGLRLAYAAERGFTHAHREQREWFRQTRSSPAPLTTGHDNPTGFAQPNVEIHLRRYEVSMYALHRLVDRLKATEPEAYARLTAGEAPALPRLPAQPTPERPTNHAARAPSADPELP